MILNGDEQRLLYFENEKVLTKIIFSIHNFLFNFSWTIEGIHNINTTIICESFV